MQDDRGLQTALEHLEKALCCVSCGKVAQDLRIHAGCGGTQCRSCWLVCHCPRCHETVSKESLWDLSHILELNAKRVCSSVTTVDPSQFLTALREVVEVVRYEQGLKQTPTAEDTLNKSPEGTSTSPQDADTLQEQQQLFVPRNEFGGMAYFGGAQSGKPNATGRIGRRRWQQQQEEQRLASQHQQDDSMFDFHSQSSMPLSEASVEASQEGPALLNRGGETGSHEKVNYIDADKSKPPRVSQNAEQTTEQDSRARLKSTTYEETDETSAIEMSVVSDLSHRNVMMLPPSSVQTNKRPPSGHHRFVTPASVSRKRPRNLPLGNKLVPQPLLPAKHSLQSADGSLRQDLKMQQVLSDRSRTSISMFCATSSGEKSSQYCDRETACFVTPAPRKRGEPESPQSIDSRCIPDSADCQRLLPSPRSSSYSNSERMDESQIRNTDECSVVSAFPPAREDFGGLLRALSETSRRVQASSDKDIAELDAAKGEKTAKIKQAKQTDSTPEDIKASCSRHGEKCVEESEGSTIFGTEQTAIPSQHLPNTCDFRSLLADRDAAKSPEATVADRKQLVNMECYDFKHQPQPDKVPEDARVRCSEWSHEQEGLQGSEGSTISISSQFADGDAARMLELTIIEKEQIIAEKSSGVKYETQPNCTSDDARAHFSHVSHEQEGVQGSEGCAISIPSQNLPNTCDFWSLLTDGTVVKRLDPTVAYSEQVVEEESSGVSHETQPNSTTDDARTLCSLRSDEEQSIEGSEGNMIFGTEQTAIPSQHLPNTCDFWSLLADGDAVKRSEAVVVASKQLEWENRSVIQHAQQPDSTPEDKANCSQRSHDEPTSIKSQHLPSTCDFRSLLVDGCMAESSEATVVASKELDREDRDDINHAQQPDSFTEDKRASCSLRSYQQECGQGSSGSMRLGAEQTSILSQYLPNTCDFRSLLALNGCDADVTIIKARESSTPSMPAASPGLIYLALDESLQDTDFDRARRLCTRCRCKATSNISKATTHYIPLTKHKRDPFFTNGAASNAKCASLVCLPTIDYFMALARGVPIMDRRWLEESEIAGYWVDEESFRVWGDSSLHQKVTDLMNGSDQYLWLLSTAWWRKKCGPCQMPPALRLDDYCILVVEQEHRTPLGHVNETNLEGSVEDCFESVVRENGTAADPGYYQHLTKEQIERLCVLLGAKVVDKEDEFSSCRSALTCLALVPASLSPNSFLSIAKKRFSKAVLADNHAIVPKPNRLLALRSTWLTDSIAAQCNAPFKKYFYGVLILP